MSRSKRTRADYPFRTELEVRWGDMDAQGHVNNTVYFTYCESARIRLLSEVGARGKLDNPDRVGPMLVSTSCDYHRQVVYPATLEIGVRVAEIGRRSFRFEYAIFERGIEEPVATATSVNAWVDYAETRAIPIPDELRTALARFHPEEPGL